tara:strand:+ start:52 stop:360 length:309 start_codon:yes stop_codon:yes gene_type:complete
MKWINRLFSKKEITKQCDICGVGSSLLKHTMTLGVTPLHWFDNDKPNYQVLNINFNVGGNHNLVRVTLQVSQKVESIEISSQEAVNLGFINPYGLKNYCRHH